MSVLLLQEIVTSRSPSRLADTPKGETMTWTGSRWTPVKSLRWTHGCHQVRPTLWSITDRLVEVHAWLWPPDSRWSVLMKVKVKLLNGPLRLERNEKFTFWILTFFCYIGVGWKLVDFVAFAMWTHKKITDMIWIC